MKTAADKRKADRFDCAVPVECKRGAAFDKSKTVDISGGGVGFLSKEFIPLETRMGIEIALTPDSEPILAYGQVKWVRQVADSDCYRVGMAFSDISRSLKSRLDKYFR